MNPTTTVNYSNLVSAARELARHALRTRNVRAQVEIIGALNVQKSDLKQAAKEQVENNQHNVEKATYQLAKLNLDATLGDPDFAGKLKTATENLELANKWLAEAQTNLASMNDETNENMKHLNAEVKTASEKIARWESGENKVQLENVNKLAQEYIEKALNEKARALSSLVGQ